MTNKITVVNKVNIAVWVWWYAKFGFSHRRSFRRGQERSPKSTPTTGINNIKHGNAMPKAKL